MTATVTFEDAALECVRSGFPRSLSIEFVIVELFERIGHLLYSQAFVDDPARADYVFDLPRLDASLACWEDRSRLPGGAAGGEHPGRQRRRAVPRPGRLPAVHPVLRPVEGRRTGRDDRDPAGLRRPGRCRACPGRCRST